MLLLRLLALELPEGQVLLQLLNSSGEALHLHLVVLPHALYVAEVELVRLLQGLEVDLLPVLHLLEPREPHLRHRLQRLLVKHSHFQLRLLDFLLIPLPDPVPRWYSYMSET